MINKFKLYSVLMVAFFIVSFDSVVAACVQEAEPEECVTVAILAKDKAHTLPLYLECLERQTWPAEKIYLYVRTNNNNDDTAKILRLWIAKVEKKYADIFFDDSDVECRVQDYGQHEWNSERFKVLGKIRQDSVDWAQKKKSHYFVVDCDNFIHPHVLETLVKSSLPIVSPLLRTKGKGKMGGACLEFYANFHAAIDKNGYYAGTPVYCQLLNREIEGLVKVPVVHCTYLIRQDVLDKICYDDGSGRYEYVIFCDSARKNDVAQYLDTRELYGRISFAETEEEFASEVWLDEFSKLEQKVLEPKEVVEAQELKE